MAKLYFRYGTVSSAKTLNLLSVVHNYKSQNKNVLLIKPVIDDRFGVEDVCSRAGLKKKADILLRKETKFIFNNFFDNSNPQDNPNSINLNNYNNISCIIVDEVQFLSPDQIENLYDVTIHCDIPVICYGLKTDFKGYLFDGSKRLLELADSIEEEKTTCFHCNKKATFNMKLIGEIPVFDGEIFDLGSDEKYRPVCKRCYEKAKFNHRKNHPVPE